MTEAVLQALMGGPGEPGMLQRDLSAFLPELIVCLGIWLLLMARLMRLFEQLHVGILALFFTLTALTFSCLQWAYFGNYLGDSANFGPNPDSINIFNGLLILDRFGIFVKIFLYG